MISKISWPHYLKFCKVQPQPGLRNSEHGSVLVVVLLILLVLSLIGTTAMINSSTGVKIASNLSLRQNSFYASDGALELGREILNDVVDNRGIPTTWSSVIQQTDTTNDIVTELTILNANTGDEPDILTTLGSSTITADIDMVDRENMAGSSAEFGSGYEGIGMGSQGGFANFYTIQAGTANTRVSSGLINGYRKTIGVGG